MIVSRKGENNMVKHVILWQLKDEYPQEEKEQIKAVHAFCITMNNLSEVPIAQKKQKEIVQKISHYLHHQFEEDKTCN